MKLEDFESLGLKKGEMILIKFHDVKFNLKYFDLKYITNKFLGFYIGLYNVPKGIKCIKISPTKYPYLYQPSHHINIKKVIEIQRLFKKTLE